MTRMWYVYMRVQCFLGTITATCIPNSDRIPGALDVDATWSLTSVLPPSPPTPPARFETPHSPPSRPEKLRSCASGALLGQPASTGAASPFFSVFFEHHRREQRHRERHRWKRTSPGERSKNIGRCCCWTQKKKEKEKKKKEKKKRGAPPPSSPTQSNPESVPTGDDRSCHGRPPAQTSW